MREKRGKNQIFIKEHAENTDFGGESVSYEKILAENSTLRKRVKELMRVIKKMEEERVKLKDEIKDLNDDVINSLVAERDEILKSKFAYMDKLEESTRTMKKMDEERNTLQSDNEELRKILAERDSPKYDGLVAKSSDLAQSTDSGISMYLDSFKEQIEKKIDSTIDIKLNERQFLAEKK